jgi:hypothetical protein
VHSIRMLPSVMGDEVVDISELPTTRGPDEAGATKWMETTVVSTLIPTSETEIAWYRIVGMTPPYSNLAKAVDVVDDHYDRIQDML